MDVALVVAGAICVAMAFGHGTIGLVWVLPSMKEELLPRTPFGPRSLSVSMVRVTWHIVTVFVLALGAAYMTLAWAPASDEKTLLLRIFAVTWLVATAMAAWVAGSRVRSVRGLLRLPVPLLWALIAVLSWTAS